MDKNKDNHRTLRLLKIVSAVCLFAAISTLVFLLEMANRDFSSYDPVQLIEFGNKILGFTLITIILAFLLLFAALQIIYYQKIRINFLDNPKSHREIVKEIEDMLDEEIKAEAATKNNKK